MPVTAWLAVGLGIPIAMFFVYSFWEAGLFHLNQVWTLDRYREVLNDPLYSGLLVKTIGLGLLVAAVVVPLAYAAAYAMRFGLGRRRNLVLFLVILSALASYLMRIYSWKTILGPNGVINGALQATGLITAPLDFLLFGNFSVVITLVHILLPVAILPIAASMQNLSADVVKSGRDLGSGAIGNLIRVSLPLTMPGVIIAFLLTFILAAGDYVTPQLVGGWGGLMVGRVIYDQFGITANFPLAAALAFSLIVVGTIPLTVLGTIAYVLRRFRRKTGLIRPIVRVPTMPFVVRRVPWGRVYLTGLLGFLYFPLVVMVVLSFNDSPVASLPFRAFTLRWYEEALGDPAILAAFATSLRVGLIVALTSVCLGVPAAFVLARRKFALRGVMTAALVLPIAIPGIVVGFSILVLFRYLSWQTSLVSVILGQVTLTVPFVVFVVFARLRDFDWRLEEAGRDLGCTPTGVLRRVTIPLILPAVLGSALLVFAMSMDEFVVTNYVIGHEATLPTYVWGIMTRRGVSPTVNAIATFLLVVSFVTFGLVTVLSRLRGVSIPRARTRAPTLVKPTAHAGRP